MSFTKYLLLGATTILLASGAYLAELSFLTSSIPTPPVSEIPVATSSETTQSNIQVKTPHVQTEAVLSVETPSPEAASPQSPNVTLSVAEKSYLAFAPSGSTVLDVMHTLASTSNFTFSGKDYPSLGFFVDSINGKKAESGYNWILYVGGKLSGTGASQTTLNPGDTVEWRYEKNY